MWPLLSYVLTSVPAGWASAVQMVHDALNHSQMPNQNRDDDAARSAVEPETLVGVSVNHAHGPMSGPKSV